MKRREKKAKYGMRKLSVGLMSCLLGFATIFSPVATSVKTVVYAETNEDSLITGEKTPKDVYAFNGEEFTDVKILDVAEGVELKALNIHDSEVNDNGTGLKYTLNSNGTITGKIDVPEKNANNALYTRKIKVIKDGKFEISNKFAIYSIYCKDNVSFGDSNTSEPAKYEDINGALEIKGCKHFNDEPKLAYNQKVTKNVIILDSDDNEITDYLPIYGEKTVKAKVITNSDTFKIVTVKVKAPVAKEYAEKKIKELENKIDEFNKAENTSDDAKKDAVNKLKKIIADTREKLEKLEKNEIEYQENIDKDIQKDKEIDKILKTCIKGVKEIKPLNLVEEKKALDEAKKNAENDINSMANLNDSTKTSLIEEVKKSTKIKDVNEILEKARKLNRGTGSFIYPYFDFTTITTSTTTTTTTTNETTPATTATTGWFVDNSSWYYADKEGKSLKSTWLKDDNKWYYLYESGKMASNEWVKVDNVWYWANTSGRISQNEWVYVNGSWFWANTSGRISENEWIFVNDSWYYAENGGYIVMNQWKEINGKWYFFNQSGALLVSTTTPDGYKVNANGEWI